MEIIGFVFWSSLIMLVAVYFGYYFLCWYTVKTKKLKIKKNKSYKPHVSLIIPTWNEENTIEGKLKNTFGLKYPKNKLEVIVIDSGSTDNTKKIVKKFKNVKLITEKTRKGKANALNKAFKFCRGEILAITDADSRLKENILLKTMLYFFDPNVGALTGKLVLINPDESMATKAEKNYRGFYHLIRNAESILDSTPIFHGPYSAFRKDIIEDLFKDSIADDTELAMRVRKKNFKTLLIDDAIFWEYTPTKFSERIKLKQRRAHGIIQVMFRFFSTFFFNPHYSWFGFLIFPVEFFMHVISPILVVIMIVTSLFLPFYTLVSLLVMFLILLLLPSRVFILTFLHSQYACLKGTFHYAFRKHSYKWEKIQGTRRYK